MEFPLVMETEKSEWHKQPLIFTGMVWNACLSSLSLFPRKHLTQLLN